MAKTTLKKKDKVGRLTPPAFRTYSKAIIIKTLWYRCKDRYIDQKNRKESANIDPHVYGQPIFDKG